VRWPRDEWHSCGRPRSRAPRTGLCRAALVRPALASSGAVSARVEVGALEQFADVYDAPVGASCVAYVRALIESDRPVEGGTV
jgi:hypothetical protein